jgi:hypothetical protein
LHTGDSTTGASIRLRVLASKDGVHLIGWTAGDAQLALVQVLARDDTLGTDTVEVVLVARDGTPIRRYTVHDVVSTSRVPPHRGNLYFTRKEKGISNLYAFSLTTATLRSFSENSVLDVSFSSAERRGPDHIVFVRHERAVNIHLFDARPPPPRESPGASRR